MSQEAFERRHGPEWAGLERTLSGLEGTEGAVDQADAFPEAYRAVCAELALARHRGYTASLVDRLNALALRGYRQLYPGARQTGLSFAEFVTTGFPRAVRAEARLLGVSAALSMGVGALAGWMVTRWPDLVYSFLGPDQVQMMESMYDPTSDHFLHPRESDSDVLMFGFYIRNNIGISFRVFSGGILCGLGSIFFLLYNGLSIGAVAGHLTRIGFGGTFWPFVIGHSAFELTAIVLSGQAGLMMGRAMLWPNRRTRSRALAEAAMAALPIVYGFAGMLFIAACLEAFWSSSAIVPSDVKILVGSALWVGVIAYFTLAGRSRGP